MTGNKWTRNAHNMHKESALFTHLGEHVTYLSPQSLVHRIALGWPVHADLDDTAVAMQHLHVPHAVRHLAIFRFSCGARSSVSQSVS